MSRSRLVRRAAICAATVLLAIPALASTASASSGRNPVVGLGQRTAGQTYGQWSAAWWQWAASIPQGRSPLFDDTGDHCDQAQQGPVWFLAGSFAAVPVSSGFAATATRRCEVPGGRSLFFPILNAEADNLCPVANPPATVHGLRQQVAALLAPKTTVTADLDGVPIRNVDDYRAASPAFTITYPAHNICPTTPGSSVAVADGYYLMLKPLSPGAHTLHFVGTIPGFSLDITYHLRIDD